MNKKIILTMVLIISMLSLLTPVFADSKSACVAIGADNTESQLNTVYGFFNIKRGSIEETIVTNTDEHNYLDGIVTSDKIGSVALSCVYVQETTSDGIDIKSYNIDWVTDKMYESALTTAGIKNAEVIVAAYTPVSGTGALTGIYKAYEIATGDTLDEDAKTTAVEEVVTVGELQDAIGDDAINIINSLKGELAQTKDMTEDELREFIVKTAADYDVTLTNEEIDQIQDLVNKFNALNIDPDTFIKLAQAGNETKGFFSNIESFFNEIGNFFNTIF